VNDGCIVRAVSCHRYALRVWLPSRFSLNDQYRNEVEICEPSYFEEAAVTKVLQFRCHLAFCV
jgi:hypothetical protein